MFDEKQKTSDYMSIVLTHECNKACEFCVDRYRGSDEFISMENIIRALQKASKLGISDILLLGGEPTLHPDIVGIAELVNRFGFRSILTTNYTSPSIIRRLDGIIDCFNISFYQQPRLPKQDDFTSDLTLHTLIHQHSLASKTALDEFMERMQEHGHLKFSTLTPCNEWAKNNQQVGYLDELEAEWVVLFNEMLGQIYNGSIIKRYDRVIRSNAHQSLKCHVDGSITNSWNRGILPASTGRSADNVTT